MSPVCDAGLRTVHSLYDLQADLQDYLTMPKKLARSPKARKSARQKVHDYTKLLRQVKTKHRGYLGGEDVLSTLETLRSQVLVKIGACGA